MNALASEEDFWTETGNPSFRSERPAPRPSVRKIGGSPSSASSTEQIVEIAEASSANLAGRLTNSRFRDEVLSPSQVIAEWHGQVIDVLNGCFTAELRGTIGDGVAGVLEEAQIPIDEVRDDDRDLLQPGAFFRLCVNVEYRNRTRRRYTDVIFRRMPAYRREELELARLAAAEIADELRLE